MCIECGCSERAVTIDAPVRTSTKSIGRPSYTGGDNMGGDNATKTDASVINGWNIPAPYGKGN